jgi:hypothetical protein
LLIQCVAIGEEAGQRLPDLRDNGQRMMGGHLFQSRESVAACSEGHTASPRSR